MCKLQFYKAIFGRCNKISFTHQTIFYSLNNLDKVLKLYALNTDSENLLLTKASPCSCMPKIYSRTQRV